MVVRALPMHRLGGLEFHTWDLARALRARGHEVHVVTSAAPGEARGDVGNDRDGVRVHFLPAGASGDYSVEFFRGAGRLAGEIIEREKCDVLHSQEFAGLFIRGMPVPHVCTVHGTMTTEVPLDRRYWRRLGASDKARVVWRYKTRLLLQGRFRGLLRNADELLVDSEFSFREVLRVELSVRGKLNLVPLGVDFSRYNVGVDDLSSEEHWRDANATSLAAGEGHWRDANATSSGAGDVDLRDANATTSPLRVALLGRVQEQKGLRVVFDAARLLRDRKVSFVMNIGGAGDFSSQLHALVREHGMESNVILHGRVPEEKTSEFLSQNDLFLFPDLTQPAFGLVAVEAMHHGLPIVGARSGAIPEVVTDETGWIYDGWSPDALAATLQRLAENRVEIAAKACAARSHAAQFSAGRMAEMTEKVYLKALAQTTSSAS